MHVLPLLLSGSDEQSPWLEGKRGTRFEGDQEIRRNDTSRSQIEEIQMMTSVEELRE